MLGLHVFIHTSTEYIPGAWYLVHVFWKCFRLSVLGATSTNKYRCSLVYHGIPYDTGTYNTYVYTGFGLFRVGTWYILKNSVYAININSSSGTW